MISFDQFEIENFNFELISSLHELADDSVERLLPVFGCTDRRQLLSLELFEFEVLLQFFNRDGDCVSFIRLIEEDFGYSIHGCNFPNFKCAAIQTWKVVIKYIFALGYENVFSRCLFDNNNAFNLLLDSGFIVAGVFQLRGKLNVELVANYNSFTNSRLNKKGVDYSKGVLLGPLDFLSVIDSVPNNIHNIGFFENTRVFKFTGTSCFILVEESELINRITVVSTDNTLYTESRQLYVVINELRESLLFKKGLLEYRIDKKYLGKNFFLLFGTYVGENKEFWLFR